MSRVMKCYSLLTAFAAVLGLLPWPTSGDGGTSGLEIPCGDFHPQFQALPCKCGLNDVNATRYGHKLIF